MPCPWVLQVCLQADPFDPGLMLEPAQDSLMECGTVDKLLIECRRSRSDMRGIGAAMTNPPTLPGDSCYERTAKDTTDQSLLLAAKSCPK
jgi:hypothetical protein